MGKLQEFLNTPREERYKFKKEDSASTDRVTLKEFLDMPREERYKFKKQVDPAPQTTYKTDYDRLKHTYGPFMAEEPAEPTKQNQNLSLGKQIMDSIHTMEQKSSPSNKAIEQYVAQQNRPDLFQPNAYRLDVSSISDLSRLEKELENQQKLKEQFGQKLESYAWAVPKRDGVAGQDDRYVTYERDRDKRDYQTIESNIDQLNRKIGILKRQQNKTGLEQGVRQVTDYADMVGRGTETIKNWETHSFLANDDFSGALEYLSGNAGRNSADETARYAGLNQDEKDTILYLIGSGDRESARKYYEDSVVPELDARNTERLQKEAEKSQQGIEAQRKTIEETARMVPDFYRVVETERDKLKKEEYSFALPGAKATAIQLTNKTALNETGRGNEWTQDEIDTLLYLLGSGDEKSAQRYHDLVSRRANREYQLEKNEEYRQMAKDNKPLGVIVNIANSYGGLSALAETLKQNVKNKLEGTDYPVDIYSQGMEGVNISEATEQGITEDMGEFGQFLAKTGLSMSRMATMLPFGHPASLWIMSADAAGRTAKEVSERGGSDDQALWIGLLSGAIEFGTEKLPLENLFRLAKSGNVTKHAVREMLKQAGIEGTEELVSEYANTLLDMMAMGENSSYNLRIQEYIKSGLSMQEAKEAANAEFFVVNPIVAGLGGMVSGFGFGGGGVVWNKAANYAINKAQNYAEKKTSQTSPEPSAAVDVKENLQNGTQTQVQPQETEPEGIVLPTVEDLEQQAPPEAQPIWQNEPEPDGIVLPTVEDLEKQDLPETQPIRQSEPEPMIVEPGTLPTAEQAELQEKAAKATSETERTGILYGASEETIAQAQRLSKALGRDIRFFREAPTGEGVRNGKFSNGTIYINTRSQNPVAQIISHELTHSVEIAESYGELHNIVLRRIAEEGGSLQKIREAKAELYARNGETLNSKEEIDREIVAEYVEKHLLTDEKSIANLTKENIPLARKILNWFNSILAKLPGDWGKERLFLSQARDAYAAALKEATYKTNLKAAQDRTQTTLEGLRDGYAAGELDDTDFDEAMEGVFQDEGESYSISETYQDEVSEWDRYGRPDGETFILGATSDVLQGLGAMENDIYMLSDKMNTIMREHPEMTVEEIKRIPEILDDPILVLKSKGHGKGGNSRLVIFGSLKAQNGQPILTVLDLMPREGKLIINDMQKVNSAYTKTGGAANFIMSSDALYADEKRTIPLLRSAGLTIASQGLLHHGSMGSISYNGGHVNMDGVPMREIVEGDLYDFNAIDVEQESRYNNEKDNEGGGDHGRGEVDYRRVRGRIALEDTGERTSQSTGGGRLPAGSGEETGIGIHTGGSGRSLYAQDSEGGVNYGGREVGNRGNRGVSETLSGEQAAAGIRERGTLQTGVYRNGSSERNGGEGLYREDSEGRRLTAEQAEKLQGTAIVDDNGNPLAVYHFTPNMEFETFEKGDVGFHFGTQEQAAQRGRDLKAEKGRMFRVCLNIQNPVKTDADIMGWNANGTALKLWSMGILNKTELEEINSMWEMGGKYDSPASVRLREILAEKGYDGIAYPNDYEGEGDSYIAFHDDQIIQTDVSSLEESRSTAEIEDAIPEVKLPGGEQYSISETEDAPLLEAKLPGGEEEDIDIIHTLPKKAQTYLRRAERVLLQKVGDALSVPSSAQRDYLQGIVREVSKEYLETGKVSQETLDGLFERAYEGAEPNPDESYGVGAEEFKKWAKHDFEVAVNDTLSDLRLVKRYVQELEQARASRAEMIPKTLEEAMDVHLKLKDARRTYEKVAAKNLLTEHDETQVSMLLRGDLDLEHLNPKKDNVKGITAVFEAKKEYERLARLIREYKKNCKRVRYERADELLQDADLAEDKKTGFQYSRETMERNVRDIWKDQEQAEAIIAEYFTPVHKSEAASTRMKNKYRQRVKNMNLSRKVEKGNLVSESHAVQLLGEAMDNIRMLEQSRGKMKDRDGKTLDEWKGVVEKLWKENPNLDAEKIQAAIAEFRKIYDELFTQMNEARVRNGYEPVNYRNGYFPHFQPGQEDSILARMGKMIGIGTDVSDLPTMINGITHTFRPGIQWFGNTLERLGFGTAYDAVEGFDRYIEGASAVIHQTDNIQNLRALADRIRYRTSDDGIRKQVDDVLARTDLLEEDKQNRIEKIYAEGKFSLSKFVVELEEYTNLLANKKSRADRNVEQALGRKWYNVVKRMESLVASNMVGANVSSALTNLGVLAQGWSGLSTRNLLGGMGRTLASVGKYNDGIAEMSDFLTNRRGSDPLAQRLDQKWSSGLSWLMDMIDRFSSESLVRARYYQNLKRGLSETEALNEADMWTAGLMGDRSKGAMPTLFNRSSPLTKLFTQFQLEVNNQFGYLFKDLPRDKRNGVFKSLVLALLKFAIGSWLFNNIFEWIMKRRAMLDPIDILADAANDFAEEGATEAGINLGERIIGELPFTAALNLIGIDVDGGRVPISSAMPDIPTMWKALTNDEWDWKKRRRELGDELLKPLAYLASPIGGGGQMKKAYEGIASLAQGGSYSVDNEGNDILQYPVYNDTWDQAAESALRSVFLGKTSLPTAQEWIENDFDSLGAKETACYQQMTGIGVPQKDAYELLKELRAVEKTEEESESKQERRILKESDISEEGKGIVYYELMASDKERELMDELENEADIGEITSVLMEIKDAEALSGAAKSNAKRDAIADAALSNREKKLIYRYMLGTKLQDGTYASSRDDDIIAFEQAGMDFGQFLRAQNEYTTIEEQYNSTEEQSLEFSRWVNSQALTVEQADTMRECFTYFDHIPHKAERYDKFMDSGLSDDAAYDLTNKIEALEPEPGEKNVSNLQRYRAVVDAGLSEEEQMMALSKMMGEAEYQRMQVAYRFGVDPASYVACKEVLPKYDADGNDSLNQKEVKAAIDSLGSGGIWLPSQSSAGGGIYLTNAQKAVLWQMQNKSWKPKGNPYDTRIGEQVFKALNAKKEDELQLPSQKGKETETGIVLPTAEDALRLPSQR